MDEEETIKLISQITEINDIHEFMNDEALDKAMATILKLISKPDVPTVLAPSLIVQLQAISAKCATMSRYYTSYKKKGEDAVTKKNTYYTMKEALDRLVDALKYSARFGS
jgi:hypothetical protein